VMLRTVLPGVKVEYLAAAGPIGPGDAVLALDESELDDRLYAVTLFKALQLIEGRRYRKGLADYVAFDTETTGKDVEHCEIIEIAAVRVRGGQVAETFHSLMRCGRPIPPSATAVHGYTDADLRGQPTLAEVWPRFRAFVGDDVLVVHNGRQFD